MNDPFKNSSANAEDITTEDISYTKTLWADVWEKQERHIKNGHIIPKGMDIHEAIKTKQAKKLTDFIYEVRLFAGDRWKEEMVNFRKTALVEIENEEKRQKAVENFEKLLNKIDWKKDTLLDNEGNPHEFVLISDTQVVTKSGEAFFVWEKSTGNSMMLGCHDLKIMVLEED